MSLPNKTITIDCDGVLSATAESILTYNHHTIKWISADINDITNHRFHMIPKFWLTIDEAKDLWYRFYEQSSHENLFPEPGAIHAVRDLKEQWYRLIVVTARVDAWKDQTLEWLEYYFPDMFDDVVFTNDLTSSAKKKWRVSSRLWASLHIDDHIDYAECTCNYVVPTFLFTKPWNRVYTVKNPLMTRVQWWKEVLVHMA